MIEYRDTLIEASGGTSHYPANAGIDPRIWFEVEPCPTKVRREARVVFTVRLPWVPARWRRR